MPNDEQIEETIREQGWYALAVAGTDDEPPFLYTIGLAHTFGHSEVMIFGFEAQLAYSIVSEMVAQMKKGQVYSAGQTFPGLLEGYDVAVGPVHPTQHLLHLGYATAFYRRIAKPELLSAIQVFWPDEKGNFPFELSCDPRVARLQPRMELAVLPSELRRFMNEFGTDT